MDMTDGAGGELPVQTNATGVMSPHKKNELNKEHDSHAAVRSRLRLLQCPRPADTQNTFLTLCPPSQAIAAAQSMLSMTGGGYVDDGVVLKWGQKWKFFVVVSAQLLSVGLGACVPETLFPACSARWSGRSTIVSNRIY